MEETKNVIKMLTMWKDLFTADARPAVVVGKEYIINGESDCKIYQFDAESVDKTFIYLKYYVEKHISDNKMNEDVDAFVTLKAFKKVKSFASAIEQFSSTRQYLQKIRVDFTFFQYVIDVYTDIVSEIEDERVIIKIEILPNEESSKKIANKYEQAISEYLAGSYEAAIRTVRDVFKDDLRDNLEISIQHFKDKTDDISVKINNVIQTVSDLRHSLKAESISGLSDVQKQAVAKLAIENLLSIRNFVYLFNNG